jgi:pSer/pThr/pTyr-binding forkhead associated (FHA) protein
MASLLIVGTGTVHEIPAEGLVIGRDPGCGIVLDSRDVSRRHARVMPSESGYTLVDDSTNGVFVNGERAAQCQLLAEGDVLRMGDVIFRFSTAVVVDAASVIPEAEEDALLRELNSVATPTTTPIPRRRPSELRPSVLLATLDVVEGSIPHGMRFRIERPVAQMGRGAANDICLIDQSVSGAHATLMLRRNTWYVLDHSSLNGTYVDGRRVNQCALPGSCDLRLGAVTLRFRPAAS